MIYYDWIQREYKRGTREELRRWHMDYEPQETEEMAVAECRAFLRRRIAHNQELIDELPVVMARLAQGLPFCH